MIEAIGTCNICKRQCVVDHDRHGRSAFHFHNNESRCNEYGDVFGEVSKWYRTGWTYDPDTGKYSFSIKNRGPYAPTETML